MKRGDGLKVLHVIPALAARYGGPSAAVVAMVEHLNRLPDVTAEIAATNAAGACGVLAKDDVPGQITVHLFPVTLSERWKFSFGLRQWLRSNVARYDLVHIHAVWSYATAAAANAARSANVPYIIRPAGMLSAYSWNRKSLSKRAYWRLAEKRSIAGASGFHVTSEGEAAEVRAARPGARTYVISNGVEDSAFNDAETNGAPHARRHFPDSDRPLILFMSRLHPKKGIVDRLLPAIAAMQIPVSLVIAGTDDSHSRGHETQIRGAVNRLGLHDRVRLIGNAEGDDRWALLDQADVFVLPSHAENFGIVVAEAMARRCPVVITDEVQSGSHVVAAGAGEVVRGDIASIAGALDRVVTRSDRKQIFGQAGRAYAEKHFRWANIAHEIRNMYGEVLGSR